MAVGLVYRAPVADRGADLIDFDSTLPHGSSGGALEHRRENRYAPAAASPSDRTLPSLEANAFGSGEIKPLRGMADALSTASRWFCASCTVEA